LAEEEDRVIKKRMKIKITRPSLSVMTAGTTATTTSAATEAKIPNWKVAGDWFDVCKCSIPCPCGFAQAPTYGDCGGILVYNIKKRQLQ
jgi:hypothetical protein